MEFEDINIDDVLKLCEKNSELKRICLETYSERREKGDIYLIDDNIKYDVELAEDHGEDVIALYNYDPYMMDSLDEDEKKEHINWGEEPIQEDIAKLLEDWNWGNITLMNGKHLIITDEDNVLTYYILNPSKLRSGVIELYDIMFSLPSGEQKEKLAQEIEEIGNLY